LGRAGRGPSTFWPLWAAPISNPPNFDSCGPRQFIKNTHNYSLTSWIARWFLWHSDITKFKFGRGSAPDPAGGANDAPPGPLGGGYFLPIPHLHRLLGCVTVSFVKVCLFLKASIHKNVVNVRLFDLLWIYCTHLLLTVIGSTSMQAHNIIDPYRNKVRKKKVKKNIVDLYSFTQQFRNYFISKLQIYSKSSEWRLSRIARRSASRPKCCKQRRMIGVINCRQSN